MPFSPQDEVTDALAKYAHASAGDVSLNTVGPTWGSEVSHKALEALIVFFIVLALYLTIRFEAQDGVRRDRRGAARHHASPSACTRWSASR